jgi:hypothetical protein
MGFDSKNSMAEAFAIDANEILDDYTLTNHIQTPPLSLGRSRSNPTPSTNPFCHHMVTSAKPSSSPLPPSQLIIPTPTSSSASQAPKQSSPAKEKYKCHCGYQPTGEERWKSSNLARHKRTQHPAEVKIYRCPLPSCRSTFTRSDNLRSHVREKGHEGRHDTGPNLAEGKRSRKRRKLHGSGEEQGGLREKGFLSERRSGLAPAGDELGTGSVGN